MKSCIIKKDPRDKTHTKLQVISEGLGVTTGRKAQTKDNSLTVV